MRRASYAMDDSVFIDAGTTTERMTDYITNRKATYMTNGIVHAQKLAQRGFRVNIVSGAVKKVTLSVIGVNAVKSLSNLNFTKWLHGCERHRPRERVHDTGYG